MAKSRLLPIVFLCALLISGCGGGGGGSSAAPPPLPGPSIDSLTGTWSGTLEDGFGGMHTFSITFGSPTITLTSLDGVNTGLTGTVTHVGAQTFAFLLSDGTKGVFFVDASAAHALLVDDFFEVGVVEKGAVGLPAYLSNDSDGTWSGTEFTTITFDTFPQITGTFTCSLLACTGIGGNGVTSNASLTTSFDGTFGRWIGTFTNSLGASGEAHVFMSPDKTFVGVWACDNFGVFPDDCDFTALNKQ